MDVTEMWVKRAPRAQIQLARKADMVLVSQRSVIRRRWHEGKYWHMNIRKFSNSGFQTCARGRFCASHRSVGSWSGDGAGLAERSDVGAGRKPVCATDEGVAERRGRRWSLSEMRLIPGRMAVVPD